MCLPLIRGNLLPSTSKLITLKTWHRPLNLEIGIDSVVEQVRKQSVITTLARIELSCRQPKGYSRWFLFRRCLEHRDDPRFISYYQVFAPSNTPLNTLVEVVGGRWRIEECFQFAKDQLGLGDYEVRSWTGWHHHVTLVLAAQAFLSVLRYHVEPPPELSIPPFFSTPVAAGGLAVFRVARGRESA